jgi:hypothetical protein
MMDFGRPKCLTPDFASLYPGYIKR